jgi:hypothetical protein
VTYSVFAAPGCLPAATSTSNPSVPRSNAPRGGLHHDPSILAGAQRGQVCRGAHVVTEVGDDHHRAPSTRRQPGISMSTTARVKWLRDRAIELPHREDVAGAQVLQGRGQPGPVGLTAGDLVLEELRAAGVGQRVTLQLRVLGRGADPQVPDEVQVSGHHYRTV